MGDVQQKTPVRWETIQVLFSDERDTKLARIGIVAEIVHPKVRELPEEYGEPRLNITITRMPKKEGQKEKVLRLFCPEGELVEIDALRDGLIALIERRESIAKAVAGRRRVWNEKRIKDHSDRVERDNQKRRRDGNKGVGSGLSRFSVNSKSEKKKAGKGKKQ